MEIADHWFEDLEIAFDMTGDATVLSGCALLKHPDWQLLAMLLRHPATLYLPNSIMLPVVFRNQPALYPADNLHRPRRFYFELGRPETGNLTSGRDTV